MSAIDVLRSFAEAREHYDVPIRDGITYGTARAVLAEVERLRQGLHAVVARLDEDWNAPALRGFGSRGSTIQDAKRLALDALEKA